MGGIPPVGRTTTVLRGSNGQGTPTTGSGPARQRAGNGDASARPETGVGTSGFGGPTSDGPYEVAYQQRTPGTLQVPGSLPHSEWQTAIEFDTFARPVDGETAAVAREVHATVQLPFTSFSWSLQKIE